MVTFAWFEVCGALYMRSLFFWDVTQRRLCFGTISRSNFQGSSSPRRFDPQPSKMGPTSSSKKAVFNYQSAMRSILEEHSSQVMFGALHWDSNCAKPRGQPPPPPPPPPPPAPVPSAFQHIRKQHLISSHIASVKSVLSIPDLALFWLSCGWRRSPSCSPIAEIAHWHYPDPADPASTLSSRCSRNTLSLAQFSNIRFKTRGRSFCFVNKISIWRLIKMLLCF